MALTARGSHPDATGTPEVAVFVHKRIIRGVGGAVGGFLSGGVTGAISGGARGLFGPVSPPPPTISVARTPGIAQESPSVARLRANQQRTNEIAAFSGASRQSRTIAAASTRTTPGLSTGSPTLDAQIDRLQRAGLAGLAGFAGTGTVGGAALAAGGALFRNGTMTRNGLLAPGMGLDELAGMPVVVEPIQVMQNRAPAGYKLVRRTNPRTGEIDVFAVLEPVARKFIKPRSKPPISASDWKKLKTAKRVEGKAKKIAQTAGFVCRTSKR